MYVSKASVSSTESINGRAVEVTSQLEVITPRILSLCQEGGRLLQWEARGQMMTKTITECYQQSPPAASCQEAPVSWTKLRTIYGQNENNKKDLQQWLHPKWSMWWWNYVDTELCIYFLTFSIVLALRGPVWAGDCCFFVIRHFRRTHILSPLVTQDRGRRPVQSSMWRRIIARPRYFFSFSRML